MLKIFRRPLLYLTLTNILLGAFQNNTLGQVYSGYLFDDLTKSPVNQAEVKITGTDIIVYSNSQGYFELSAELVNPLIESKRKAVFSYDNKELKWSSAFPVSVSLFDIKGKNCGGFNSGTSLNGNFKFPRTSSGIYLLRLSSARSEKTVKIQIIEDQPFFNLSELGLEESLQIQINCNGYEAKTFFLKNESLNFYYLTPLKHQLQNYLNTIPDSKTYEEYEGKPLNNTYNDVTSIKFVYEINTGQIFYINSKSFLYHYEFATEVMGYNKPLYNFNIQQYTNNPQRIYILGSVNHYISSDIYTMEFFGGDELDCNQIKTVYDKIAKTCFFGNNLRFYANTTFLESCSSVPQVKSEELFRGQDYQALNPGVAFGYLKKVNVKDVSDTYLGRHDIPLINGIPNDIPVVAGIITTEFQTPLSHINILSRNRKTPNMALRSGWDSEILNFFNGKLVRLEVSSSKYTIREASIAEAENYWKSHEPSVVAKLTIDTLTKGIVELNNAGINAVKTIGGKAANFAELNRISSVKLPEGGFTIPFFYYKQHLKQNGLDIFIEKTISDQNFRENSLIRELMLKKIRDTIKNSPIDPILLDLVTRKIQQSGYDAYRFRSSTNAEDVEGFNGAGLYDSYTGIPGDTDKTIEKAIKKVWASLWNFRAFEERDYFKIDHTSIAMGILVHRSFPAEDANGVVITTNLYNSNTPGFTINSQFYEFSVVRPENNVLPEQIIYYTILEPYKNRIEYVNKSNLPNKPSELVLTEQEVTELAEACKAITRYYCTSLQKCYPLDIEFKIDSTVSGTRKLYIKQARPFQQ